jgi:hypothetical protein
MKWNMKVMNFLLSKLRDVDLIGKLLERAFQWYNYYDLNHFKENSKFSKIALVLKWNG